MEFKDAIKTIAAVLQGIGSTINEAQYDGLIVKKLEASNTLDPNRTTKQSHIAITGAQMDMFPYVRADGYFEVEYENEDSNLKKFFVAQIPAYLHKANLDYLDSENTILTTDEELVHISIVRSRRNDAADQIQMSMTYMDSPKYIQFRKAVHTGSFMIMLKRKNQLVYDLYAVKSEDIAVGGESLNDLNNCFYKLPTNTPVKIDELKNPDVAGGVLQKTDTKAMYDEIFDHNLFGIHIKNQNDALSEERPHICIGWSRLGDLSDVSTVEELGSKHDKEWPDAKARSRGQNVGQIWRFLNDVQIGDFIIYAEADVCHIGRVTSDYYYDSNEHVNQDPDYKNTRDVVWLKTNIPRSELSQSFHLSLRTAMSIWTLNDYKSAVADLLNGTYVKDEIIEDTDKDHISLKEYQGLDLAQRKLMFIDWMSKLVKPMGMPYGGKPYSDGVIKNYADSLEFDPSKLTDFDCENKNLFFYVSLKDYTGVKEAIKKAPNFAVINEKRISKGFTCALDKYSEFLESLESTVDNLDVECDTVENKNCLQIILSPRTRTTHPLNFIIYGAPGTGKTYSTAEYALAIVENRPVDLGKKTPAERKAVMNAYKELVKSGQIVFTTFHQSYGYEEFIQGLRPDTAAGTMSFKTIDGVFKKIADEALNHPDKDYVIIIDEINRANISKVFGELITLIEDDKRWGEVNELSATLQSSDPFAVPNNLYIVGTMNSADKSISLIDAALRRRFAFIEQRPDNSLVSDTMLRSVLKEMNIMLADKLESTDLLVGHSYFMNKGVEDLCDIMNNSIIPLLYEYFYDQRKRVRGLLDDVISKTGAPISVDDNATGRLRVKMNVEETADGSEPV